MIALVKPYLFTPRLRLSREEAPKVRIRSQNVNGIPGSRRLVLTVSQNFAEKFDQYFEKDYGDSARQLEINEFVLAATSEAQRPDVAASELKHRALEARPGFTQDDADVVNIKVSLPTPLLKHLRVYAERRGLSLHEFVLGAISLKANLP